MHAVRLSRRADRALGGTAEQYEQVGNALLESLQCPFDFLQCEAEPVISNNRQALEASIIWLCLTLHTGVWLY